MSIMCFFAIAIAYVMRVCLSVAITEMVAKPNVTNAVSHNYSICVADPSTPGSSGGSVSYATFDNYILLAVRHFTLNKNIVIITQGHSGGGEYHWSQEQQGWILSSFYIGYVLTHVPGGVIAEKYGGKWTLSLGILSTAIFTLLTPFAVQHGKICSLFDMLIAVKMKQCHCKFT